MAQAVPVPEPIDAPILHQRWEDVGLVHWACPPEVLAPRLPEGLEIDRHDGAAWVSLLMFRAVRTRLPALPPIPGVSDFAEINLRTYATAPGERPGIWFLDLEAPRPVFVAAAQALAGIPYRVARTSVERTGDDVTYASDRDEARLRAVVRAGPPLPDSDISALDHFVTARWGAYSLVAGELRYTPVAHPMWPLHRADLVELDETLTRACDVPAPPADALVHFAPVVDEATLGIHRRAGDRGREAGAERGGDEAGN